MEFEQIVIIVIGLIVILQQFYIHKSIPMDKVPALLKELRPLVEQTPTRVDNVMLDAAEQLTGILAPDDPAASD